MRHEHLRDYLPDYYDHEGKAAELLNDQEIELRKIEAGREIIEKDLDPMTAIHIELWENEFGIVPGATDTLEERRQRVQVAMLGRGTYTKKAAADIGYLYTNHVATIGEDPDNFLVIYHFDGTERTVTGYEDLVSALLRLMPAHATVTYEFHWKTWGDLEALNDNWEDIDTVTWDAIRWTWWGGE